MTLTPEIAKSIVEKIPGAKPVLSTRGASKGQHVKYNFRFEFAGPPIRHIAITRRATSEGVTVYVNQYSVNNEAFSNTIVRLGRVTGKYPRGYKGRTGDKGLSSSAAQLSTLDPEMNDVLRLSVLTEEGFQQLLAWYLELNSSLPSDVTEKTFEQDSIKSIPDQLVPSIPKFAISEPEQNNLANDTKSLVTDEKEAVVKVRYGQGGFRDALISIAGEKCWMTGLEGKQLLIASHIKPWSHCDEDTSARGETENGLLLSALWDSAFDAGLVTFDESWGVLASSRLSESAKNALNLNKYSTLPIQFRSECRAKYLEYHRLEVFEN